MNGNFFLPVKIPDIKKNKKKLNVYIIRGFKTITYKIIYKFLKT